MGRLAFSVAAEFLFPKSTRALKTDRINCNGADEYRRRHTPIDIAVAFVGFLLVGGEGRDAGGIGSLDDAIEVETDGFVGFLAEVGQVEGNVGSSPFGTDHKLANLHLKLDGIDEDHIVGTGMIGACLLNKGWGDICHSIGIGI